MRVDINEDSDLSLQLRDRYKLLFPPDLAAGHYGVPTTLRGVWHRGYRDGLRIRALIRAHRGALQLTSMSRLVPLPLGAAIAVGGLTLQPWLVGASAVALGAYVAAFLAASRRVHGDVATRAEAAMLFVLGNVGFGLGFVRESLARPAQSELVEPTREAQR